MKEAPSDEGSDRRPLLGNDRLRPLRAYHDYVVNHLEKKKGESSMKIFKASDLPPVIGGMGTEQLLESSRGARIFRRGTLGRSGIGEARRPQNLVSEGTSYTSPGLFRRFSCDWGLV